MQTVRLIVTVTPADFPEDTSAWGSCSSREIWKVSCLGAWRRAGSRYSFLGIIRHNQCKHKAFGEVDAADEGWICPFQMSVQYCRRLVGDSIEEGMLAFGRKLAGFDRDDALLSGVESRTSSPVRIVRRQRQDWPI